MSRPLPELCPVSSGGAGTIEVLLPALGGETGDGFALIEDGGTAIVELDASAELTAERLAAAAQSGAEVVLLAAGRMRGTADVLRAAAPQAATAASCSPRSPTMAASSARHSPSSATPRAPSALAERLRDEAGARLVAGVSFLLDALEFDARMRAARAVIVGDARLERGNAAGTCRWRDRDARTSVRRPLPCRHRRRRDRPLRRAHPRPAGDRASHVDR